MTIHWKALLPILPLALLASAVQAGTTSQNLSQGQQLAAAGDCIACHTVGGGKSYAGGLKMSTPIGAIYSTNITPDKETGIGNYSYDDFAKAVREGVAKDGRNLYPAMPYTSYAKINDRDLHTLYDFFMHQIPAVKQQNRDSDIPWPLSMRWPLSVWNAVFHDDAVYQPDASRSAQWNRGAYLVQGLAHCGTCHTPRGIGFQEKALDQNDAAYLTGGTLEGWHAPDLTGNVKSGLGRWSAQDIAEFLKTGRTDSSAAFGSMTDVVAHSTQYLSSDDLEAVAVYLKSLKSSDPQAVAPKADTETSLALIKGDMSKPGAQEYMDNCSACHRIDGQGYAKTFPALAHNSAVLSDDPSSLISVVLRGGQMAVTQDAPTGLTMPDFAWRLNDKQVADLLTFVRSSWGNNAPAVTAEEVKDLRNDLKEAKEEK
ncbi:alcohol dehydrogenase [Citrobacter amalonaticus]|uniref:Alcohol dehydrogenase n=1 Tax=Citrobacter amalonaticus TaxID=35703 RepID=A0A2S4RY73_CITAM|nr:cytochrome c [Citrobacter amalonaticus]POT57823.1 alcohol dehydrogenase [Citrobacter amalonaticus]POT76650.1 alcohol dehydrogenase [Citrobacter amalonaticus]POU65729.1 alcohol dehydrogenase [Citrobacter amalonaticus]POV05886.1 alcohol dehydrogenase [Citrobacter amalonaticus]